MQYDLMKLTDREWEFLRLACTTAMTYQQIANSMFVSRYTVDGYRKSVFDKLKLGSREALMLYAFTNKLVQLDVEA
jgi:DNA-binding CsgD family transcriptional regulator